MKSAFFLVLLFTLTTNSQTTDFGLEKLTSQIHHLSNFKSSKTKYLRMSKDIYETQEDLWLKAYKILS